VPWPSARSGGAGRGPPDLRRSAGLTAELAANALDVVRRAAGRVSLRASLGPGFAARRSSYLGLGMSLGMSPGQRLLDTRCGVHRTRLRRRDAEAGLRCLGDPGAEREPVPVGHASPALLLLDAGADDDLGPGRGHGRVIAPEGGSGQVQAPSASTLWEQSRWQTFGDGSSAVGKLRKKPTGLRRLGGVASPFAQTRPIAHADEPEVELPQHELLQRSAASLAVPARGERVELPEL